jgi:CPA1 family monovalent cation:H+ antiporter
MAVPVIMAGFNLNEALLLATLIISAFSARAFIVFGLLLGSIVSTSDPVTVVAIFKEIGVLKRLVILSEGQSLFNDATVIVAFTILLKRGSPIITFINIINIHFC